MTWACPCRGSASSQEYRQVHITNGLKMKYDLSQKLNKELKIYSKNITDKGEINGKRSKLQRKNIPQYSGNG